MNQEKTPGITFQLLLALILFCLIGQFILRIREADIIDEFCRMKGKDGGKVFGSVEQPTCYSNGPSISGVSPASYGFTFYDIDKTEWQNYIKQWDENNSVKYGGKI